MNLVFFSMSTTIHVEFANSGYLTYLGVGDYFYVDKEARVVNWGVLELENNLDIYGITYGQAGTFVGDLYILK